MILVWAGDATSAGFDPELNLSTKASYAGFILLTAKELNYVILLFFKLLSLPIRSSDPG
jgi:hypothetical protein